ARAAPAFHRLLDALTRSFRGDDGPRAALLGRTQHHDDVANTEGVSVLLAINGDEAGFAVNAPAQAGRQLRQFAATLLHLLLHLFRNHRSDGDAVGADGGDASHGRRPAHTTLATRPAFSSALAAA